MKNKQESLDGAIEVEVVWTIKEKATKVVMAEVAIHVVITQTKLQIVILTASTQDNHKEVVTARFKNSPFYKQKIGQLIKFYVIYYWAKLPKNYLKNLF